MPRYIRTLLSGFALLLIATAFLPAQSAQAQAETCFQETGYCISGRFREYWLQNGGLAVFGYPISAAKEERNRDTGQTYLTQHFERNRFELHTKNARPYDVLLGRLGEDRLIQVGRKWQQEGRERGPLPNCLWFEQTGHNVCNQAGTRGFKRYWESTGLQDPNLNAYQRSLALLGLPLAEAKTETNSSGHTVTTQWFERGRLEYHPNNPEQYVVLMGLLGTELRGSPAPAPQGLKFFWPGVLPLELSLQPQGSFASQTMWMLHFAQPHAKKPDVTITGGAAGDAPGTKVRELTVRGERGTLFRSQSGYVVLWSEYAVIGRTEQEVLSIAEGLVQIDRATMEQRIRPQTDTNTLKYFWPKKSPMTVLHEGSYADKTSFVLNLAWPHAKRPDAIIGSGAIIESAHGQKHSVTVRGQPGTGYTRDGHFAVVWKEAGRDYIVISRSNLREALTLAEDLEVLDLAMFQQRLQRR
jgi:hypothetical protein